MKSQGNSRTTARPDELRTRLQRVLRDELRLGCTDRLVHGGLEGFLRYWLAEIERSESRENFATMEVALSPLGGYRLLDTGAREFAVRAALAYLSDGSEKVNRSDTADTAATSLVQLTERGGPEGREPSRPLARVPLDTPLSEIKGISPARARALARLGLRRYGDLLTHYPTRHERHPAPRLASELLLVQHASFVGTVENVQVTTLRGGLKRTTARLRDQTGQVHASWLRGGRARPFIAPGQRIAISGSVQAYGRQISFENPDWEPATGPAIHTRRLSPIYPLTAGIHPYWLRSRIYDAVRREARQVEEFLPEMARQRTDLPELGWAIEQIHFPDDEPSLEAAHRRLAFDELFQIQLAVLQRRQRWQSRGGVPLPLPERALAALLDAQPYRLTAAQHRVIQELAADLSRSTPMSRLLQGEVGSGKTAVAAVALYFAVAAGYQGFLMAPTEILAEQHQQTLSAFYGRAAEALRFLGAPLPRVELLTGSATRRQKDAAYQAVSEGAIDILVGTQAVIQDGVEPRNLALSIVDEQHRFGVRQRIDLRGKGPNPHLLVMTATPIPRTLALSLHGDLDISIIDELPAGRQPIRTHLLMPLERPLAYEHIRREAAAGRQAFIICPLVEDSPRLEARAAVQEFERLNGNELAGLRLALLHGRMKPAEKDEVMRRFRDAEFDVLISTSVVEVGVDVPNATVMLVEGAERFGLAQLHQFRGRVGRGEHPSTCILLTEIGDGPALDRLQLLERSSNGLELAEFDLRQRGPGDFFGVRQSGLPELRVATLNDVGLVERARETADWLLARDPDLSSPENAALRARLAAFVQQVGEAN